MTTKLREIMESNPGMSREVALICLQEDYIEDNTYETRLVGSSFNNKPIFSKEYGRSYPAEYIPVTIVREHDNPHDEFACAVYDKKNRKLGYIERDVAKQIDLSGSCRGLLNTTYNLMVYNF